MAGKHDFQQALLRLLGALQPKQLILTGLMGARINNDKLVAVENQSGFVYVRVAGNESAIIKAFNETTALGYGLPVRIVRDELQPRSFRVIGKNYGAYPIWPGQTSAWLVDHASQHQFGGGSQPGRDVVWVHKRQFTPMLARPSSGSMHLYVEDDFFEWERDLAYFPGQFSPELTPYLPTGGYSMRYITLYLDGDDAQVKLLAGDEFSLVPEPTGNTYDQIAIIDPSIGINLCAAALRTGTMELWYDDIVDIRPIVTAPGVIGSTFLSLSDTPTAYDGGDKIVRANFDGDALRFGPKMFTLARDVMHTGTGWYDLWLDGVSGRYIPVAEDSATSYQIPIVGLQSGAGERYAYNILGIVWNDGGQVSGSYNLTTIYETTGSYDARAAFYDADDTLRIQVRVTPYASPANVGWSATVLLAETAAP